ncbi:hypothetical protein [Halorubrum amylolyticum]|uniref:hypothetical protein n=1 Tax=Halorubrum TaxID=56688 RepID=UPI001008AFAD|nr:hypothetical protein [Halorubrum amylolyticum]
METALEVLQTEAWSKDDRNPPENVTTRHGEIDGIEDFIENTDFSDDYIVIVADGYYSSQHWFEVASIDRDDDALMINITVESEDQTVDDAHAHTGLIRIQDETAAAPETLSVSVDGVSAEQFGD